MPVQVVPCTFHLCQENACIALKDFYSNELHGLGYSNVSSECDDQLCSVSRSIDLQRFSNTSRALGDTPEWVHLREYIRISSQRMFWELLSGNGV